MQRQFDEDLDYDEEDYGRGRKLNKIDRREKRRERDKFRVERYELSDED